MKKRKKKKRTITRSVLILIFVTAVITTIITEITGGLISSAWKYAKDFVWPPKLQFSITQFIIYRTNFEDFPICEMDIVVNNPSYKSITAELKTLRLFRENIIYRFATGQEIIKVGANDLFVKRIGLKDKVLDLALKIPQDSAAVTVVLTYQHKNRNSIDSLVFNDDDVIKCTYWQVPKFTSESEALSLGLTAFSVDKEIYWTDNLSGESHKTVLTQTIFMDPKGLRDFDGKKMLRDSFNWKLEIPILISNVFHRKYGGVYLGSLAADSVMFKPWCYASQYFSNVGDYDQYTLIGMTYEQDFSSIMEFVHYTFDPVKRNESFGVYQENSKFYVLLLCEHNRGINVIIDSLKKQGYRVGVVRTKGFTGFLHNLTLITPNEKMHHLVDELNINFKDLNSVINNDGFILFFPTVLNPERTIRIAEDVHHAVSKPYYMPFTFECSPFKCRLIAAPFSIPVLVFLNFSDETMDRTMDSIRVGYLPSP